MIEPNAQLNEPGLAKALAELNSILIPGESVEAWATQRRIFALSHRRTLIAATSGGTPTDGAGGSPPAGRPRRRARRCVASPAGS